MGKREREREWPKSACEGGGGTAGVGRNREMEPSCTYVYAFPSSSSACTSNREASRESGIATKTDPGLPSSPSPLQPSATRSTFSAPITNCKAEV